jgi:Flp pilus assembly secretin CpaC
MRRLSLALAAVLTLSGAAAHAQTGALPTRSDLSLGQGEAFYMNVNNGAVRDVVVVDPNVADISIINERTLVVLGKRAGFTTVMAFDGKGRTLASRQVVVSQAGEAGVTVYRGATAANGYACADRCQRVTEDK